MAKRERKDSWCMVIDKSSSNSESKLQWKTRKNKQSRIVINFDNHVTSQNDGHYRNRRILYTPQAPQAENTWCMRQFVYIENCMGKSPILWLGSQQRSCCQRAVKFKWTNQSWGWNHLASFRCWLPGHKPLRKAEEVNFKDVRAKFFPHWFFSETFTTVRWWVSYVRNVKKMGGHRLRFG